MISIKPISSVAASLQYFFSCPEAYYLNRGGSDLRAVWMGQGAEALGLSGKEVNPHDFRCLLNGLSPLGEPLVQNAGAADRKLGWELCISTPKSVSLGIEFGGEVGPVFSDAHRYGVAALVAFAEAAVVETRRGRGGHIREPAKVVAATFEHATSRASDPNRHTHLLLMNAGLDCDLKWGALVSKALYDRQKELTAVYRTALIDYLRAHGIDIKLMGGALRVPGISDAVEKHFSTRRKQIVDRLVETGELGDAAAAAQATIATRPPKRNVDLNELRSEWFARCESIGFDVAAFQESLKVSTYLKRMNPLIASEVTSIVEATGKAFTEQELKTFERYAKASKQAVTFNWPDVEMEKPHVVPIPRDDDRPILQMYASERTVKSYVWLEQFARRSSTSLRHVGVKSRLIDAVINDEAQPRTVRHEKSLHERSSKPASPNRLSSAKTRSRVSLTLDQQRAVNRLVRKGSERIRILNGAAGTGKTTTLRGAARAYQAAGFSVLAIAKTGLAARELERKAGIDEVLTFTQLRQRQVETAKDFLASELRNLHRAIIGKNAQKRPPVFDRKTLVVVDGAHTFTAAEMKSVLRAARRSPVILSGIVPETALDRARSPFVKVGRHVPSVTLTELLRGRSSHSTTTTIECNRPFQSLLAAWSMQVGKSPAGSWMIASSTKAVEELNLLAQQSRIQQGQIRTDKFADAAGGLRFHVGDRVLFARASKHLGVKSGDTGEVTGILPGIAHLARRTLIVKTDSGKQRFVPLSRYDSLELGYAITRTRADSVEIDRAFVLASANDATDFRSKWADSVTVFRPKPIEFNANTHAQHVVAERREQCL